MNTREIWKRFDIPLFAVVLLLCVFGVALISSAIAGNPTLVDHPRRQATFLIIGLVILFQKWYNSYENKIILLCLCIITDLFL